MPKLRDLKGQKFGQLEVVGLQPKEEGRRYSWMCRCDCGTSVVVQANRLVSGATRSCGCLGKHGQRHTPEYVAWNNMIQRCENPKHPGYVNYGGRGIEVLPRWKSSFPDFLQDMGKRPDASYSLERKEVNGNYEPNNCTWATPEEQASNTRRNVRFEVDGQSLTQAQLARKIGVSETTIRTRLKRGESLEEAMRPTNRSKK